jgi:hypothetical protein
LVKTVGIVADGLVIVGRGDVIEAVRDARGHINVASEVWKPKEVDKARGVWMEVEVEEVGGRRSQFLLKDNDKSCLSHCGLANRLL